MITQEQLPMVAIPRMNDTHLEEMLIINRLESAAKDNQTDTIQDVLNELLEHTLVHFSDEETMMKESVFEEFEIHKAEHDRHINELKSVIKYFLEHKDSNAITAYIAGNLAPWMIHHAKTMDTTLARHLSS